MSANERAIHWFRNDLRLRDNRAFADACRADEVVPVFVFDPALVKAAGAPRLRFLLACLEDLGASLARRGSGLVVREGDPAVELAALAGKRGVSRVTWGRDYSPYAKRRDARVAAALEARGIEVSTHCDRVVFESGEVKTAAGGSFSVFTPYCRAWWRRFEADTPGMTRSPRIPKLPRAARGALPTHASLGIDGDETRIPAAGEAAARRRLKRFLERKVALYESERDFPARDGTSGLSPHLRMGVISARECCKLGLIAEVEDRRKRAGVRKWLDELVWREFYQAILDLHPHVTRGAYRPEYDALEWNRDPSAFAAWCRGETGFPLVDAGMRQLLATGVMHNRVRMLVASFLVKDLLIDWRKGERWFMDRLVDGDPASNNGGWQWAASTGTDAQPYFRIFNPTRQAERYDPDGEYVRRWVPELRGLTGRAVHEPWKAASPPQGYPAPIVDHAERREVALSRYKAARRGA